MTSLVNAIIKIGILTDDIDYHLLRAAMVIDHLNKIGERDRIDDKTVFP